jgi:FkbM family methyltransferase
MLRVERLYGHSAVVDWLGPGSVVLDLGASRGRFAAAAIERFGCRVIAVEPVAALHAALPGHPLLRTERLAVAATGEDVQLRVGGSDEDATIAAAVPRGNGAVEHVRGVTLAELLDRLELDRAALVKMDIEGAELDVLETAAPETLARFDQLTVEFHDFLVPEWRQRVDAIDRRLRRLGFHGLRVSRDRSDILYVNLAVHPLGRLTRLWLTLRYRYLWGAARVVRKRLA